MADASASDLEDLEIHLLLEGIARQYGYDFRDYARASLTRRVRKCLEAERLPTISALQERVLHDERAMRRFLDTLTVDVTALFRDPSFYAAFRAVVVPLLRPLPSIQIWHAGCASGEEVYSMAILLQEEGLYEHARLYGTDINESLLAKARDGIVPLARMKEYTQNYQKAGGRRAFSEYYAAKDDHAVLHASLHARIVWAQHNLVTDASFQECQVILCRNVMIYFNRRLQDRVHALLYKSLAPQGVLALGNKESLVGTAHEKAYTVLDAREKLYQLIG